MLIQGATKYGFEIGTKQINSTLLSIPEFRKNGMFSLAKLQQFLAASSFSAEGLMQLIRQELLVNQPKIGIITSEFALPFELNNAANLVHQKRAIKYILLQDKILEPKHLEDSKIAEYYAQHKDDFKIAARANLEYIELSLDKLRSDIHPALAQLKGYYQDNISAYTTPERWQVKIITMPITGKNATKKEKQAAMAIKTSLEHNQDSAISKSDTKGITKWFTLANMPKPLRTHILKLKGVQKVTEPIHIEENLFVIKLLDHKQATVEPFAKVKNKIEQAYIKQEAEQKYMELKDNDLANLTYEHADSLAPAAKALHLAIKTTGFFTEDAAKNATEIANNPKVREIAFSDDVLKQKNNSEVIELDAGHSIVIRIRDHKPATFKPITEVRQIIVRNLSKEIAHKKAFETMQELQKKQQSEVLLGKDLSRYDTAWRESGYIQRHDTKINPAISQAAFEINKLNASQVAELPTGYALVVLTGVKATTFEKLTKKQQQALRKQTINSLGLLEYQLYQDNLENSAKIKKFATND